ncbi:MAG: alanine racemase [Beijerinckiaceae bacterium]|nr:alanine racemase [Beijerinckiaceae bacterium]
MAGTDVPELEAGGRLTIDLGALAANWLKLASMAAPAECAGVIKANAYGIGIEQAAPALWKVGCRTFFVAVLSEARRVRAVLPDAVVYVLNGLPPGAAPIYADQRLRPVLGSNEEIAEWKAFVAQGGADHGCAIHVDTGLNRLGLRTEEAIDLARNKAFDGYRISLLISHFVSAEEPENAINEKQIESFLAVQNQIQASHTSLSNSSGFFLGARPYMSLARPGFALYGGNPTPGQSNPMQPVVMLEARVIQVREVPPDETVGYNAQWTAKGRRRIAVLSVGYADGLTRQLSATDTRAGGYAFIDGVACPFAGRVSMDLITVDVTDLPVGRVKRGDYVELLGPNISVDDVAERGNTNGYEILTSLGRRYSRRFVGP